VCLVCTVATNGPRFFYSFLWGQRFARCPGSWQTFQKCLLFQFLLVLGIVFQFDRGLSRTKKIFSFCQEVSKFILTKAIIPEGPYVWWVLSIPYFWLILLTLGYNAVNFKGNIFRSYRLYLLSIVSDTQTIHKLCFNSILKMSWYISAWWKLISWLNAVWYWFIDSGLSSSSFVAILDPISYFSDYGYRALLGFILFISIQPSLHNYHYISHVAQRGTLPKAR